MWLIAAVIVAIPLAGLIYLTRVGGPVERVLYRSYALYLWGIIEGKKNGWS